jgi:hypothetical protein
VENLETVFDRSSNPVHLIVMMLYGMDVQLQLLLKTISKDGIKPMLWAPFKDFIDFLDTMQKDMMVGRYIQEVPSDSHQALKSKNDGHLGECHRINIGAKSAPSTSK